MAQRDIREYSGKSLLRRYWNDYFGPNFELVINEDGTAPSAFRPKERAVYNSKLKEV